MIAWKYKYWRTLGVAASTLGLAACGEGGEAAGDNGQGEGGEAAQGEGGGATPAAASSDGGGEAGEAARGESGGEHGEAGVISAYAGLSGDQLTALRIQHLRGFVMAAAKMMDGAGAFRGEPADAAVLVQQGLLEVYGPATDGFGTLDVAPLREAAAGGDLSREQLSQRLHAAEAELSRASAALDVDEAQLVVRMVDISTGLYQHVLADGAADPVEYQHSLGAALAAQQALQLGQTELRSADNAAYARAATEISRLVALWPSREPPQNPATYQQVLVQGSRVRLALSPYL
ncbi:MAG: hypothetical protein AB7T59_14765 [Hyphomonadaceae bacterium]